MNMKIVADKSRCSIKGIKIFNIVITTVKQLENAEINIEAHLEDEKK